LSDQAPLIGQWNNMTQQTIILDADDTLLDLKYPMCEKLNKYTGRSISCDQWNSFNITDIYGGLDIEDFYSLIINEKLLVNAVPYEGSKATLETLKEKGYKIVIISSRAYHPEAYEVTKQWFDEHELPYDRIHISGNGIKKSIYSNIYDNIVLTVDDNLENCEDFNNNCKVENVLLMNQPWNAQNQSFQRVSTIQEILNYL
jgi:uncharacterized HAD superfamily protein